MNPSHNESVSTFITPPTSNQRISTSHRTSIKTQSRLSRIKDKRTVFPSSTLNKIVFVSNYDGNGFQRENIFTSDFPELIDLDGMIKGVNRVCYEQWKKVFEALDEEPLSNWEFAQKIIAYCIMFTVMVFFYFMITHDFVYSYVLLFFLLALSNNFFKTVILGCFSSYCLLKQRRVEINKDEEMIKVIKRELMRLNENELIERPHSSRFTWTCQKQCLWIACEFH
jgi:hypothetical protein